MARQHPYGKYSNPVADSDLADLLGPHEQEEHDSQPADEQVAAVLQEYGLTEEQLRKLAEDNLCTTCGERSVAEEEKLRMYAEMDNFKKRLEREKTEQARYASEKVLADLLPVLDNMELALQYGGNEACKPVLMGVEMTYKLMLEALRRHGLEPVGETGQSFDPAVHEAVGQEHVPDLEPGLVSKLMQRGYKLGDRLLRPARVMVSS